MFFPGFYERKSARERDRERETSSNPVSPRKYCLILQSEPLKSICKTYLSSSLFCQPTVSGLLHDWVMGGRCAPQGIKLALEQQVLEGLAGVGTVSLLSPSLPLRFDSQSLWDSSFAPQWCPCLEPVATDWSSWNHEPNYSSPLNCKCWALFLSDRKAE